MLGKSGMPGHFLSMPVRLHAGAVINADTTASKIEAMCHPTGTGPYEDGDTAPFTVSGPSGEDLGFAGFMKEFRYLRSIVHPSLTSDADADTRTRSAAAAFGAPTGRAL